MPDQPQPAAQIALVGLFVTALTTAQLTAAKLLVFELPTTFPLTGASVILPGAAIAYALTYFASDCYTELYGKRAAQVLVNVGFLLNFALLGLVWTTITAPGLDPELSAAFAEVLAPGTNIIIGSLIAYIISQNWDVLVFHWIRGRTGDASCGCGTSARPPRARRSTRCCSSVSPSPSHPRSWASVRRSHCRCSGAS
jgi:Uncharacterized conserved protein